MFLLADPAGAQQSPIVNPPVLHQPEVEAADTDIGTEAAMITALTRPRGTDPGLTLRISMIDSLIWNPAKGDYDAVTHRGYSSGDTDQPKDQIYVPPTIEAFPGETVRIDILNHLPAEPECNHNLATMNSPDEAKCYNDTNNHFHGGWVNPEGNSDNVLRVLHPNPDVVYEYEYNIPVDHAAGTFWYHPHVHGSTAIQVGSGMAGALIVRGDRWPVQTENGLRSGDIDLLLRNADGSAIPDRVFMLQQIQYACNETEDGDPKTGRDRWSCADGEVGRIADYTVFTDPPGTAWQESGRFTTVNGRVGAKLGADVVAGQPERWRFIHGGFADSIRLAVYRMREDPPQTALALLENAPAIDQPAAIGQVCEIDGEPVTLHEIATDGLTRKQVRELTSNILHPGYRSDVLAVFERPGEYCVIDEGLSEREGIEGTLAERRLLFTVTVASDGAYDSGDAHDVDAQEVIVNMMTAALAAASDEDLSEIIKIVAMNDINDGLKLRLFSPHASLADAEIDNIQRIRFALFGAVQNDHPDRERARGLGIGHVTHAPGTQPPVFEDRRFSLKDDEVIELYLGDIDEWRLTSSAGGHPFHIHVNPFEVIEVLGRAEPDGEIVDLTEVPESQYYGLKGVFKDTIFVEPNVEVVLRSHYERYTGRFVLHCHILYHEDAGMMRLVRINDPRRPGA